MVEERIAGLYEWAVRLASRAALAGRPRLFAAATRAGEELLLLRHDLEAWEPGECFDPVEFGVRLRRIEGVLRGVEVELRRSSCQVPA